MPSRKSALKRIRSDEKKRAVNTRIKSALRTKIRKFDLMVAKGDLDGARKFLPLLSSSLDKAAKRRVIHKRNASRKKSRLNRITNAAQ